MEPTMLRLELDWMKEQVHHSMMLREASYNKILQDALDKALSEENVKQKIERQVFSAVDNAIASISSNAQIKSAIVDAIEGILSKCLADKS